MKKETETRTRQLVEGLKGHLEGYGASMGMVVGATLTSHISRACQILDNIQNGLPHVFELLQKNNPCHVKDLLQDERAWGSVVLVDLVMEVFMKDIVLKEPPQTVALILTAFFQDIQGGDLSPPDAFFTVLSNLLTLFGMQSLMVNCKWNDTRMPQEKASYIQFIKVLYEVLFRSRDSLPQENQDSKTLNSGSDSHSLTL